MSRKNLKSQLRRQQRPLPLGFNAHARSERRRRQQKWLQDFLNCFWPEVACHSHAVMAATRAWPHSDHR
eukprot:2242534-Karenia_brevis.AAC.1